jgi:hypothetical protein
MSTKEMEMTTKVESSRVKKEEVDTEEDEEK